MLLEAPEQLLKDNKQQTSPIHNVPLWAECAVTFPQTLVGCCCFFFVPVKPMLTFYDFLMRVTRMTPKDVTVEHSVAFSIIYCDVFLPYRHQMFCPHVYLTRHHFSPFQCESHVADEISRKETQAVISTLPLHDWTPRLCLEEIQACQGKSVQPST